MQIDDLRQLLYCYRHGILMEMADYKILHA